MYRSTVLLFALALVTAATAKLPLGHTLPAVTPRDAGSGSDGDIALVTERTLRTAGDEVIHVAFHEGDIAYVSAGSDHKKGIKSIAFGPHGGAVLYSDFKPERVDRREVRIPATGVYALAISPGGLTGKVITVKVERRAAPNAPGDFATEPEWVSLSDTTYRITYEARLQRLDTSYLELYRSTERVNSQTNLGGSATSYINFRIPSPTEGELVREYPIGWAYKIAVGDVGEDAFAKTAQVASELANLTGNPLAAMAIGALPAIRNAPVGEAIAFELKGAGPDGAAVLIHSGKTSLAANPVREYASGPVQLILENSNMVTGLDVHVDVTVAQVRETYGYVEVRTSDVRTRSEPRVRPFGRP